MKLLVSDRADSRPMGSEGSFGAVFPPGALVRALQRDEPGRAHTDTEKRRWACVTTEARKSRDLPPTSGRTSSRCCFSIWL